MPSRSRSRSSSTRRKKSAATRIQKHLEENKVEKEQKNLKAYSVIML